MREVLAELLDSWRQGQPVALVQVISTWHSAPRQPGSAMLVHADGTVAGSVSGGCIEADAYERAQSVLDSGQPVTASYGLTGSDGAAVGLTCGGTIEVLISRVDRASFHSLEEFAVLLKAGQAVAIETDLATAARTMLRGRAADVPTGVQTRCGHRVFVDSYLPPPRLIILGATEYAAALSRAAALAGYAITVCDARKTFTNPGRFPNADVIVAWPHKYLQEQQFTPRDAICVLSHDEKFDIPALATALASPAGYVGAMGSLSTHDRRVELLAAQGVPVSQLARLHSPIGLDLGGRTPGETAVSILAEIICVRHAATGTPLGAKSIDAHV